MINLTKQYKNGRGVSDINLDVDEGEIFGLLGPNGAGKTTIMKMMTGLIRPDRGDVHLFGYSIQDEYVQAMSQVGCIIETAESYPYLTAYENLELFSRFYPQVDKRRIEECLQLTGLLQYKDERPSKFSLGMKQRLGLAGALLSRPKLLILDEPMNGLDVEGMLELRRLIKRLSQDEGTTFFISSHLIHDVERTCTRIGIMYEGRLLSVQATQDILSSYASLEHYFISEVEQHGRVSGGLHQ